MSTVKSNRKKKIPANQQDVWDMLQLINNELAPQAELNIHRALVDMDNGQRMILFGYSGWKLEELDGAKEAFENYVNKLQDSYD